MKKRFSEEQIIRILKAADRGETTISDVCRSYGISENMFYRWRRQYTGLSIPEIRRLHALEKENVRLKRLMAERDLEIDALKELLEKSSECRTPPPRFGVFEASAALGTTRLHAGREQPGESALRRAAAG
jgi:putative transposase